MKLELSTTTLSESMLKNTFIESINLDNGYVVIRYDSGEEVRIEVEELLDND